MKKALIVTGFVMIIVSFAIFMSLDKIPGIINDCDDPLAISGPEPDTACASAFPLMELLGLIGMGIVGLVSTIAGFFMGGSPGQNLRYNFSRPSRPQCPFA